MTIKPKYYFLLYFIVIIFFQTATAQPIAKEKIKIEIDYSQKPKKFLLKAVNVSGNYSNADTATSYGQTLMESEKRVIQAVSGLAPGLYVEIPGDDISKAIKNLWKQNLFSDIQIIADSAFLENEELTAYITIRVTTRPRLSKYSITGMKKSKANNLKDNLKINAGDIVTEQMLNNIRTRAKKHFNNLGYSNAKITIIQTPDKNPTKNEVTLAIKVDKGKRIRIHKVNIGGNDKLEASRIKRVMKNTKEKKWWNPLRKTKFQPDEYEEDKETIIAFYRSLGYKDVVLVSDSIIKHKDNLVDVNIKVKEGNKYYFKEITWSGNTKFPTTDLSKLLGIKKGDPYNTDLLDRGLFMSPNGLDITSLYMDDGYLFFNVTPVETRIDGDSVDLEIRIFEGPQAVINRVTIKGNTRTHDKVLLREIRTKPGQKFSRSDIIRSQRELVQMGLFDGEKMNVNPKPNPKDGTVDLEYVVAEKPNDRVELSGGYGAGRLVGVLGLQLNNFSMQRLLKGGDWQGYPSGDAQSLTIRGQSSGPQFQSYNMSFTDPWFGGHKPNSFTVSGSYSIQRFGDVFNRATRSQLNSPTFTVGLGKRLKWPDDYFTIFHSATYQYYSFQNFNQLISNFNTGYSNNLYIRHLITRNSVDAPIYATTGSLINLSFQYTPPWSLIRNIDFSKIPETQAGQQIRYKYLEYFKFKASLGHYTPLTRKGTRKFVLLSQMDFGYLGRYNRNLRNTPFERFYVGGDGLTGFNLDGRELIRFRGYQGANDVTPSITKDGVPIEQGGIIYNKYTFELRYPIVNSQSATVYALAFAEAGNAWQSWRNYNPFELKRSAGGGVRVFLPMFGLLGFDWGYGFDPSLQQPGQPSAGHFHFYIGQPLF